MLGMLRPFCLNISLARSNAVRMLSTSARTRSLEGKVAIVTASTDGIGLAIARQLGRDGAKVVISSRKEANVDKAVDALAKEGLTVTGLMCHVGKADHRSKLIEETLKHYGGIDILVSNAATNPVFGHILETSEKAWDKIFEVNVKSAFLLAKEVVPHMEERGSGSIVFVSSIGGYSPFPGLGAYSVSKTALLGLTKALAVECTGYKVRVNCVAPGIIKTRFSEALWKSDAVKEQALQKIPLRRLGEPDDISGAVSFLCSDQASYITGETLMITGGMPCKL